MGIRKENDSFFYHGNTKTRNLPTFSQGRMKKPPMFFLGVILKKSFVLSILYLRMKPHQKIV